MHSILLTNTNPSNQTMVSNIFIDTYMPSANGSYVKVYLYLLRCLSSQRYDLSISFLADCLDNTENDIIRALNYWEKYHLITIGRDTNGNILNITINPLTENTPSVFPNTNSSSQNSASFHSNVTTLDTNRTYLNQNTHFINSNMPTANSNTFLPGSNMPLQNSNQALSDSTTSLQNLNQTLSGSTVTPQNSNRTLPGSTVASQNSNRTLSGSTVASQDSNRTLPSSTMPSQDSNRTLQNSTVMVQNSNNARLEEVTPLQNLNHTLPSQTVPSSDLSESNISSSHMIQKNTNMSSFNTDRQNPINRSTTISSNSMAATITNSFSNTSNRSETLKTDKTDKTISNQNNIESISSDSIYEESDSEIDLSISTNTQAQFPRPTYTSAQIDAMSSHEDIKWLLKIIPMYLDRTLKPTDVQLILYFYETLGFSTELITHLYDYCVSKNKKSLSYIEAVALAWAEEGIDTVEKAQQSTIKYNTNYNAVNKAFGLNRSPGTAERKFIDKWVNTYHFNSDIIMEACSRALLNTAKPDFKYANTILEAWFEKGVKNIADIQKLDELYNNNPTNTYNKTSTTTSSEKPVINSSNKFSAFPQRTYSKEDYSTLEQRLLNKH